MKRKPRIDHYPPGYDPTQDKIPPRQAKLGPLVGCGVFALFLAFLAGVIIMSLIPKKTPQTANLASPEATAEITLDAWSATGTALALTPETTAESTAEMTAETTAEVTAESTEEPTATGTLDWGATGTALFTILSSNWTATPTMSAGPSSYAAMTPLVMTPKHSSGWSGDPATSPPAVPSCGYVCQMQTKEAEKPAPQPTARPPIIITERATVIVIVTVTYHPRTITPEASPTPSATLTEAPTLTPTPSETATSTATASETATEPPTLEPTFTTVPTSTPEPTYTPTATETPTDIPTEVTPE